MIDKTINKYVIVALITIFIYLILDYFNVFSCITQNLNIDLLDIVINSIVVIFVFLITYSLVDKKTFEKEETIKQNKICTLNIMLLDVYNNCNKIIDMLDDNQLLKKYIIPKIDFNSTQNQVEDNLKKLPFENEKYIVELFSDGIAEKEVISNYFNFKGLYQQYIRMKITFFDIANYKEEQLKEMFKLIEKNKEELKKIIKISLEQFRL